MKKALLDALLASAILAGMMYCMMQWWFA